MVEPFSPAAPGSGADGSSRRGNWLRRGIVLALCAVALGVVWFTNDFLTQRFTETVRNRSNVRLALYTGNVTSEVQRTAVVPLLLARDPALIGSLNSGDFSTTSPRRASAGTWMRAAMASSRRCTPTT